MNGTVVQCEKRISREKSKNTVRLGGVSKLVAQFSDAVRGLSTEGTVQWQCNPGENSVMLGGVSVSVGLRV